MLPVLFAPPWHPGDNHRPFDERALGLALIIIVVVGLALNPLLITSPGLV